VSEISLGMEHLDREAPASLVGTDRVDLLRLSFVDSAEDYAGVMSETGLLGIARDLCRAGKARFIGLSTHVCSTAALMFPVNPVHDPISDRSRGSPTCRAGLQRHRRQRPVEASPALRVLRPLPPLPGEDRDRQPYEAAGHRRAHVGR
jgi:hypothetical protein